MRCYTVCTPTPENSNSYTFRFFNERRRHWESEEFKSKNKAIDAYNFYTEKYPNEIFWVKEYLVVKHDGEKEVIQESFVSPMKYNM